MTFFEGLINLATWPFRKQLLLALSLLVAAGPLVRAQESLHTDVGPVGPFSLTDHEGKAISNKDLLGKVWVAHFFFTTCTGGCTKTAPTMAELQKKLKGKSDYALVSISLNQDSAGDLRMYAANLGADPAQWFFLTGPKEAVQRMVRESFKQSAVTAADAKPGQEVVHSFNLVVVDSRGEMRGYVDGQEATAPAQLHQRMRELVRPKYLLPAANAMLNFLAVVLLVLGYRAIRLRWLGVHKVCMLAALTVSAVFLASYLYFHFAVLDGKPTRFQGEGAIRVVYFAVLVSHTVLAILVAPLALTTAYLGLRGRLTRHVRIARWTLPIWLYVSLTGVVVYGMLYHLYPPF